jgi:hypothetical protein
MSLGYTQSYSFETNKLYEKENKKPNPKAVSTIKNIKIG